MNRVFFFRPDRRISGCHLTQVELMNSVIKASGLLVNLEQRLEKGAAGVFSPRFFVVVVEGWNAMGSWWNPWDIACMNGISTDPWMVGPLIC